MERNIKVIEIEGQKKGKTIAVLVGVHGNELCGVKALDSLIPKLNIESGKIIFIYANLEAIKQNKRFIEANLNRCFLKEQPLGMRETLEGKTAKEIMPYLNEADVALDIHASFTDKSSPFVICNQAAIAEAAIFDSEIVTYNWDPFEPGSTDYYMNLQGKTGFCFECGFLKDPKTQEKAEQAIISFLIFEGAIPGKVNLKENQRIVEITGIYKNINSQFKKARNFADFDKVKEKTAIGKEGNKEVFVDEETILLFVTDCERLNDECFLTAKEKINKTERAGVLNNTSEVKT